MERILFLKMRIIYELNFLMEAIYFFKIKAEHLVKMTSYITTNN